MIHPLISCFEATAIIDALKKGKKTILTSLDLGLSNMPAVVVDDGVLFDEKILLTLKQMQHIVEHDSVCFTIVNNTLEPLRLFSGSTSRMVALLPTGKAPALTLSGVLMHRVKNADPQNSAEAMARTAGPCRGEVLDTATGLGYAAIEAAKTARHVTTIEIDPEVRKIARQNPWSQALFDNPRIDLRLGDSTELLPTLEAERFGAIIHDPPMFSVAGELYAGAFYKELFRVLKRGGKLFHYIGDPTSGSGARVTPGVIKRLREAGFTKVEMRQDQYGVLAYK